MPLAWVLCITAVLPLLGLFAAECRSLQRAVGGVSGALFQGLGRFLALVRTAVWDAVRPAPGPPVSPVKTLIGLALLACAALVIWANLRQLTAATSFFFGESAESVAVVVVVLGSALGALLEGGANRKLSAAIVCLLAAAVAELNRQRAVVVLDGPVGPLVIVFSILLQVAEVVVVWGGLRLAGPAIPVLVAAPLLLPVGILEAVARLLVLMHLDAVLSAVLESSRLGPVSANP